MRKRLLACAAVAVLISVVLLQPVAGQSSEYGISVAGSIDTPDRTVTFDGESYHVSEVKQSDPGDTVTVDVTAPSDQLVTVYIYNADRQIMDSERVGGSGSVTFDLSGYSAGSYMFTVENDGDTKVAHPLVVRAYDVSVSAPSTATAGDDINLSASLTQLRDGDTSGVEFVLLSDDDSLRVDATQDGDQYTATADTAGLSAGEYSVYATVRGTEEVEGNKERLGISNPASLSLESDSSSDDGGDGGSSGTGATGDGETTTETTTESTTETSTETATETSAPSETDTTTQQSTDRADDTDTAVTTTTDSDAITPQQTTSDGVTTTSSTGPGFGAAVAVLAVVSLSMLALRREQS